MQVTHTNDLASLALTHSALHNLVIPNIYSRFDIVWPDAHSAGESRTGVDALTYGLATLVMSEEIFEKNDTASRGYCETCACDKCMLARPSKANSSAVARVKTLRRGNNFPQYTRKFSLGNGPTEWVQEYLITKEGGKMLGTLVALSITRMHNLETFIWDMPTGILRDVWLSLASPSSCKSGQTPKLQKVWVRFHDNREIAAEPASPQVTATTHDAPDFPAAISNPVNLTSHSSFRGSAALYHDSYSRIQHPNFSILPPLKSLSVLDIDEIAYLSELSVAIEKSVSTLRELRISMALYLTGLDGWAEHPNMTGCLDSSGVIGAIMAKLLVNHFDTELPFSAAHAQHLTQNMTQETTAPILAQDFSEDQGLLSLKAKNGGNGIDSVNGSSPIVDSEASEGFSAPSAVASNFDKASSTKCGTSNDYLPSNQISSCDIEIGKSNVAFHESVRSKILGLEILEIESVALDVNVLQNTIDWSIITTLTLLRCGCHERLWKELRRKFAPRSNPNASKSLHTLSQSKSKRPCQSTFQPSSPLAYSLRLKKVHTDTVTPALISFLKDALAPNTLECMFLQDSGEYDSKVSLESIYRGPIRRHHASLKKLMIDSAVGMSDHTHYLRKKWMFNRDLLKFVTSGKMSMLKELAMAIDYEDWVRFYFRCSTRSSVSDQSSSTFSFKGYPKSLIYVHYTFRTLPIMFTAPTQM